MPMGLGIWVGRTEEDSLLEDHGGTKSCLRWTRVTDNRAELEHTHTDIYIYIYVYMFGHAEETVYP